MRVYSKMSWAAAVTRSIMHASHESLPSLLATEQLNTEKRPINQWAFVKYSHLKSDLQTTLLSLLQRLEITAPCSSAADGARLGQQGDLRARLAVEQNLTSMHAVHHACCCYICICCMCFSWCCSLSYYRKIQVNSQTFDRVLLWYGWSRGKFSSQHYQLVLARHTGHEGSTESYHARYSY